MKRPKSRFEVTVAGFQSIGVMARTRGHAARQVFRILIAGKLLKRQPQSDPDGGGWKGVSIEP